MRVAGVDPAACEESAIGFRLAPRINAAGRLGRPEAALELLLTDDPREATRLAEDLEVLNRERQGVEERILRAAIDEIEAWPEARRRHRGYVVAGEDWHEGVIGIVASRLVERYGRPVVLIAGTDGNWKGSGRSTAAFDLHGALAACAEHLERFGGHRAAAGLTIRPECVEAFARGVRRARRLGADATSTCARASPSTRSSQARSSGSPLCEELGRLAPFGLGNPGVTLLVDGCELDALSTVGDGKHLRFRVRQRGRDAGAAIAFGQGGQLDRLRRAGRYDVAFRLQENRWNGTVSPQLVVRRIFDASERFEELRRWLADEWARGEAGWSPTRARSSRSSSSRRRRAAAEPARVEAFRRAARRAAARGAASAAAADDARLRATRGRRQAVRARSSSSSTRATRRSFLICRRRRNMGQ